MPVRIFLPTFIKGNQWVCKESGIISVWTIRIIGNHCRIGLNQLFINIFLIIQGIHIPQLITYIKRDTKLFGDRNIRTRTHIEYILLSIRENASLMIYTRTYQISHFFRTTGSLQTMTRRNAVLYRQIQPVCVRITIQIRTVGKLVNIFIGINRSTSHISLRLILYSCIFRWTDRLRHIHRRINSHRAVITESWFTHLTAFCGYQQYTICGPWTINSRRCCIFQYINTLNIFRIQEVKIGRNSIDQHQRFRRIIRLQNGRSAQLKFRGFTRGTFCCYIQARNLPLQSFTDRLDRTVLKNIRLNRCHSRSNISLPLCTVSHDHYFIQVLCILFQYNGPVFSIFYRNLLFYITNVWNH